MAADLITVSLADENSAINVSPKDVKVYTALANMLREYPESYEEAYELTKKAVKQEPNWEESHNMMGNCLVKLGRFSEARDAFKKSVSLSVEIVSRCLGKVFCRDVGQRRLKSHLCVTLSACVSDFTTSLYTQFLTL